MSQKTTIRDLITDLTYRIEHIEDTMADNREIMVKLVKQGNQIIKFLKDCVIEEETEIVPVLSDAEEKRAKDFKAVSEILDEYLERHKELSELEKELKKHKDKLTPGTIGES